MLQDAIEAYRVVLKLEDKADDNIYREAGERCVQLLRFGGNYLMIENWFLNFKFVFGRNAGTSCIYTSETYTEIP